MSNYPKECDPETCEALTAAQKELAETKAKLDRATRCLSSVMLGPHDPELASDLWSEARAIVEDKTGD